MTGMLAPPANVQIVQRVLARRFPGVLVWFGPYTRRWWAMVSPPRQPRLLEASDPDELTRLLINVP
jgi:hypothetical protein